MLKPSPERSFSGALWQRGLITDKSEDTEGRGNRVRGFQHYQAAGSPDCGSAPPGHTAAFPKALRGNRSYCEGGNPRFHRPFARQCRPIAAGLHQVKATAGCSSPGSSTGYGCRHSPSSLAISSKLKLATDFSHAGLTASLNLRAPQHFQSVAFATSPWWTALRCV